jgi:hypothetical protein
VVSRWCVTSTVSSFAALTPMSMAPCQKAWMPGGW